MGREKANDFAPARKVHAAGAVEGFALDAARYDSVTIYLHWGTAVLTVLLWGVAQITAFVPKGAFRHDLWSSHVLLGGLFAIVLAARIMWRTRYGRWFERGENSAIATLGKAMHGMLYAALVVSVVLGLANVWARGWDLFGLIEIPKYDPADTTRTLARTINFWHDRVANLLIILASVHAFAALFRHYIRRDGVLRRMTAIG